MANIVFITLKSNTGVFDVSLAYENIFNCFLNRQAGRTIAVTLVLKIIPGFVFLERYTQYSNKE